MSQIANEFFSHSNVKINFENLEIELFQQVINKKVEDQAFIDSILIKFCKSNNLLTPIDVIEKDTLLREDSLFIEIPKPQTE